MIGKCQIGKCLNWPLSNWQMTELANVKLANVQLANVLVCKCHDWHLSLLWLASVKLACVDWQKTYRRRSNRHRSYNHKKYITFRLFVSKWSSSLNTTVNLLITVFISEKSTLVPNYSCYEG